jgi:hypothetical protein
MLNKILLQEAHLDLDKVCLIRHTSDRVEKIFDEKRRSPYELWSKERSLFDNYQSYQLPDYRRIFSLPYWVVFVGQPKCKTMFIGLYAAEYWTFDVEKGEDVYKLRLLKKLNNHIGKLFIDWGGGYKAWKQYAEKNDKHIL